MKIDDLIEGLAAIRQKHGPDVGVVISLNRGEITYSEPKEVVFVERDNGPHVMIRDWTIR